jgi:hypothetical protein
MMRAVLCSAVGAASVSGKHIRISLSKEEISFKKIWIVGYDTLSATNAQNGGRLVSSP